MTHPEAMVIARLYTANTCRTPLTVSQHSRILFQLTLFVRMRIQLRELGIYNTTCIMLKEGTSPLILNQPKK